MYDENHTNWHVKYIIESRHASIILGGYGKILKQFELFTILVFEGSSQQSKITAVWTVTTRAIFTISNEVGAAAMKKSVCPNPWAELKNKQQGFWR